MMFVQISDMHCDSGMYNLNYLSSDCAVESKQRFETLSVLHRIPQKKLNAHITPVHRRALQMEQTELIKKINVIKNNYARRLPCGKKLLIGKSEDKTKNSKI